MTPPSASTVISVLPIWFSPPLALASCTPCFEPIMGDGVSPCNSGAARRTARTAGNVDARFAATRCRYWPGSGSAGCRSGLVRGFGPGAALSAPCRAKLKERSTLMLPSARPARKMSAVHQRALCSAIFWSGSFWQPAWAQRVSFAAAGGLTGWGLIRLCAGCRGRYRLRFGFGRPAPRRGRRLDRWRLGGSVSFAPLAIARTGR